MRLAFLVLAVAVVLLGAGRASSTPDYYMVRIAWTGPQAVGELAARGFDIAGVDLEAKEFSVVTDMVGLKQLKNIRGIKTLSSKFVVETLDTSYKKPSDIETALKKIAFDYPNLAVTDVIGRSTDGRDIYAIKLTDRFFIPDHEKPTVLIDAMHHAREVMTPEVALDIADYLTSKFATDPKVQEWLRLNEIWIVPMLNPDGNNRVWTNSSMWRKNTRGGYGVDNNRNYPQFWGSCNGSSGNTGAEDYRGPNSASEPETKALMDLATRIKPVVNLTLHSASEMVLYPYGCPNQSLPAAQGATIKKIAAEMGRKLVRDSGNGTYAVGTPPDLLYPADGGSIDWMFAKLGALSFVIEMNSTNQGFQPSFSRWRDATVQKMRPGWQYLLDRIAGPSIRVETGLGMRTRLESPTGTVIQEREADEKGWTHFIVEPGDYRVVNPGASWGGTTVTVRAGTAVYRR